MKSDFKKLWVLASILTISGILLGTHGAISGFTGNHSNITLADANFAPLDGTTNYQIKLNLKLFCIRPYPNWSKIECRYEGTFIKWDGDKNHVLSPRVHC